MTPEPAVADEQLVSLSKDGRLDAFNRLVERYQGPMYNLCLRLTGSPEAAEDATQEALLSAYRAIGGFHGGSVRSWLLRIAANQAKDELRRRRRKDTATSIDATIEGRAALELPDPGPPTEALAESSEVRAIVQRALHVLPHDQRLAIILIDLQDHDYRQVAEVTGWSMGTVKSRVSRGRAALRVYFSRHPELLSAYRRLDS